jgi:hypothetical protein
MIFDMYYYEGTYKFCSKYVRNSEITNFEFMYDR